jgi:hypothetical protein
VAILKPRLTRPRHKWLLNLHDRQSEEIWCREAGPALAASGPPFSLAI